MSVPLEGGSAESRGRLQSLLLPSPGRLAMSVPPEEGPGLQSWFPFLAARPSFQERGTQPRRDIAYLSGRGAPTGPGPMGPAPSGAEQVSQGHQLSHTAPQGETARHVGDFALRSGGRQYSCLVAWGERSDGAATYKGILSVWFCLILELQHQKRRG